MEEIFKDVPGYEGIYVVSNLGTVKRLKGYVYKGKTRAKTLNHEKILMGLDNGNGYKRVNLCFNGLNKSLYIHQIVAMSFLGHIPDKFKLVINHINFNKSDNRVENLEIVTNRENSNKRQFEYTSKYPGVYFAKTRNKWGSAIRINRKQTYLGFFINEIDAHNAYQNKLNEITK